MANTEDLTALRQDIRGLSSELKESKTDRRRLHVRNRWLTGVIVLLACATGGSIFAAVSANSASNDAKAASDRAASVAHANYQTCVANNSTRQENRALWAAIIGTIQPLTTTPQGQQFVANLQHDVDIATAPRVCRVA